MHPASVDQAPVNPVPVAVPVPVSPVPVLVSLSSPVLFLCTVAVYSYCVKLLSTGNVNSYCVQAFAYTERLWTFFE